MDGPWNPLGYVHTALTLGLPTPISFFFLACISFYILCQCLRLRPWASVLGAIAFAYCTFDPIIITAGHNTQMFALAYAPALLGGVILLFEKKYISGFVFTALFSGLEFLQNHQQISYYVFMVIGIMGIAYLIRWIKAKETMHIVKAVGLSVVALTFGILINANNLFVVYDYAKESKRAGQLVMDTEKGKSDGEQVSNGKTTGLSKPYAFTWSYGKTESLSLMFAGIKGYGLYQAGTSQEDFYEFPKLDENSNLIKTVQDIYSNHPDQAQYLQINPSHELYWGEQPSTSGPVYLGAIICFLFIIGMFYLDAKHKWWILAASLLGIVLAWGSNFPSFNYFFFDHFPWYNKFRAPTMSLVIPQILFALVAALVVNKMIDNNDPDGWKKIKKGLFVTGGVFVIAAIFYMASDFSKENKAWTNGFNDARRSSSQAEMNQKLKALNEKYSPEKDDVIYASTLVGLRGAPDAY